MIQPLGFARDHLLLGAAGASMLFTQYVFVREIGSTFLSTEIVLLGATLITLAGPSVGYAVAHRIPDRVLATWGAVSLTAHLALPVGWRALVGELAVRGLKSWALIAVAALVGLVLSGFHAVFLPRCARTPRSLPAFYAAELAGALAALAVILLAPSFHATLALYWATCVLVLHLGIRRRAVTLAASAVAIGMVVAYPRLDHAAARCYYANYHRRREPVITETAYSPFQRVDVVDDASGRRTLYLDGVWFFRSGGFDGHNRFLAELPGALHPGRGQALAIGSGSFSTAAHLRHLGYDVTVVEVDEVVARIGFARFGDVHRLRPGEVHVVIADGRRYLAETTETFDVIAVDVPAPYQIRTAVLHTPAFYRLAADRLRPGGVIALSLCGSAEGTIGRVIAAAASEVFSSVIVVESETSGLAHLYAGSPLPFSPEDAQRALAARDPAGGRVFGDAEVRALVRGVAPITEAHLAPVLVVARDAMGELLRGR